jgi:hypothetical protein
MAAASPASGRRGGGLNPHQHTDPKEKEEMDPEYAAAFAVITGMWEKEFLVSPRYLAGTDGNISPVIEPLDDADWSHFHDEFGMDRLIAPDHMRCLTFRPNVPPRERAGSWGTWRVWGRRIIGRPTWSASFTYACPPELVAAVTTALVAPAPGDPVPTGNGMEPLAAAGWHRRRTSPATTAYTAPTGQATVQHTPPPKHLSEPDRARVAVWRAIITPAPDKPILWQAEFTADTPVHLVTAFCTALADPEPLHRCTSDLDAAICPYLRLNLV